jgi:hypothetical protein
MKDEIKHIEIYNEKYRNWLNEVSTKADATKIDRMQYDIHKKLGKLMDKHISTMSEKEDTEMFILSTSNVLNNYILRFETKNKLYIER